FCSTCTRARLTADGWLYTCLYGTTGLDLRSVLRSGAAQEQLSQAQVQRGLHGEGRARTPERLVLEVDRGGGIVHAQPPLPGRALKGRTHMQIRERVDLQGGAKVHADDAVRPDDARQEHRLGCDRRGQLRDVPGGEPEARTAQHAELRGEAGGVRHGAHRTLPRRMHALAAVALGLHAGPEELLVHRHAAAGARSDRPAHGRVLAVERVLLHARVHVGVALSRLGVRAGPVVGRTTREDGGDEDGAHPESVAAARRRGQERSIRHGHELPKTGVDLG
ncbi:MAG: hypothetical protein KC656_20935, partial [Myxococcales bacterium]|nr:hypothetical protein [Myxococcales bacterium]